MEGREEMEGRMSVRLLVRHVGELAVMAACASFTSFTYLFLFSFMI